MGKLSTGKGNLVTSTQRLETLGAKVKKAMPNTVLQCDDEQVFVEDVLLADSDGTD
jgi:DNA recombination protein RmuC